MLTALIVDAYKSLAEAADEAADEPVTEPRRRLRTVCAAIRCWARSHPREYALIYGSPVPGYRAPQVTVESAARIPLVLLGIVRAGWIADLAAPVDPTAAASGPADRSMSPVLTGQLQALAAQFAPELPEPVLASVLMAWTQLFGMVSFELFGQLVGSVEPSDDFFGYAVERMADLIGLPPSGAGSGDPAEAGRDR